MTVETSSPEKWTFPIEEKQTIIIYHEIAHVLNKDMGFMTWAWVLFDKSSTATILLLSSLLLSIIFYSQFVPIMFHAMIFYIAGYAILAILHSVISRKRELIADRYALLYANANSISFGIEDISRLSGESDNKSNIRKSIEAFIVDKSLFSKRKIFWRVINSTYAYVFSKYPPNKERQNIANDYSASSSTEVVPSLELAIWVGIVIGIAIATVVFAYGAFQYEKLGYLDSDALFLAVFNVLGYMAMPYMYFLTFIFSFSNIVNADLNMGYLHYSKRLCSRYAVSASFCMLASMLAMNVLFEWRVNVMFLIM